MLRRTLYTLAALTALSGALAFGGHSVAERAAKTGYRAVMSAANEVPPNSSPATGTVALSTAGTTLSYRIDVKDLSSGATAAHIHGPAGPGNNAGVLVPLAIKKGAKSGRIGSGTVDLSALKGPVNADSLTKLLDAGMTYVNVHTTNNPSGEIRGWVQRNGKGR